MEKESTEVQPKTAKISYADYSIYIVLLNVPYNLPTVLHAVHLLLI